MDELEIIRDLLVVYAAGGIILYLFQRLGQSAIVAFLITGVLIGPNVLSLIAETESVRILAEVGVMLLLFSVGLEFSLRKLAQIQRIVFATGPVQVGSVVLVSAAIAAAADFTFSSGLLLGCFFALSSTAMIVKTLLDQGEVDSLHGRTALGILIFQDLMVVPIMVLIPQLAVTSPSFPVIGRALLIAAAVLAGVVLLGRYLFPFVLRSIVEVRSRELFVVAVLVMLLGTSWLTGEAGFSMALGAFLAGLMLSVSEYSHHIFSEIRPFRDGLNSLFFISIGMLVDPAFLLMNWEWVSLLVLAVVLGKALLVGFSCLLTGVSPAGAVIVGLALAQVGEFSFIVLEQGARHGLVGGRIYQLLIGSAVSTMLVTPVLFRLARRLGAADWLRIRGSWLGGVLELPDAEAPGPKLSDHVIICGFGVTGRNIARALRANQLSYLVLETNPQTIRQHRNRGEPIFYGDCTHPEILQRAGIAEARVIVFAISELISARRGVPLARALSPGVTILIRTQFVSEIDDLYNLGASEVVPQEFEATIELVVRTLRVFNLPRDLVGEEIRAIREGRYGFFRDARTTVPRLRLSRGVDVYTETTQVDEWFEIAGQTIAGSNLRRRTGALILGIIRKEGTLNNPGPDEQILPGDLLVLSGTKEQLNRAIEMVRGKPAATGD